VASYKFAYAGIGTRNLTVSEHLTIQKTARILSKSRILLYSGNAPGSDQAFQYGSKGDCVCFLPWDGFEKQSFDYTILARKYFIMGESTEGLASIIKYHPNPTSLSKGGKALMARNFHQIHGVLPDLPMIKFVVCCADPSPNGGCLGGTGQAVRIAMDLNIPIINIRVPGWAQLLKNNIDIG